MVNDLSDDNQNPFPFSVGGIALLPLAAFFLLSAVAFALGWLDWETNGGRLSAIATLG